MKEVSSLSKTGEAERKMQKEEKERIEFEHKEKIRNELERNKVEQQTIKDIIQDKTTLLKNIQDETRKEYEEMILAFETKHGIINLKKEIDDNRKSIIRLEAQSKNICDHPVSCRKSSAEGWSHSWYCDLCNFKDIDYYGPGN